MNQFVQELVKGVILSFLYYEVTKAQDTEFQNIFLFTSFYIIMANGAHLLGIDPNVVTNAFITKSIFTLVDERLQKKVVKQ